MGSLEWIKPGAEAVVLHHGSWGLIRVEGVTIERVLKRDVVLSSGGRFKLTSARYGSPHLRNDWQQLVPPDDPTVAEALREIEHADVHRKAKETAAAWARHEASAADVIAAFQALADSEADAP